MASERRRGQNRMMKISASILNYRKSRMRMMLALQAFVAFGFLFIPARLYFLAAYETEQKSLLEPIQVDDWRAAAPRLRLQENSVVVAPKPNEEQHFAPNYFTNKVTFETLLARDNILSVYTGCSIAAWTYGWHENTPRLASYYDDCGHYNTEKGWTGRDITTFTVSELQPGDTVYVELKKLDHFALTLLPLIQVDIVLISGQNHVAPMKPPLRPPYSKRTFRHVIDNPSVTHWFMMNLDKHSYDPFHPKHYPFPYGLSHVARGAGTPADYDPKAKSIYLKELKEGGDRDKRETIFVGYINRASNPARALIPSGEKLQPEEYYKRMHESKYVLSPDGDRPECYRHYEAIGLRTKPITQLHPHLYRHLEGSVIFNETRWDLAEMTAKLSPSPTVNRRLIFEEYWIEYVERSVGRELRWWDSAHQRRTSLSEITRCVTGNLVQDDSERAQSPI